MEMKIFLGEEEDSRMGMTGEEWNEMKRKEKRWEEVTLNEMIPLKQGRWKRY